MLRRAAPGHVHDYNDTVELANGGPGDSDCAGNVSAGCDLDSAGCGCGLSDGQSKRPAVAEIT
jgi:hypothetical protein